MRQLLGRALFDCGWQRRAIQYLDTDVVLANVEVYRGYGDDDGGSGLLIQFNAKAVNRTVAISDSWFEDSVTVDSGGGVGVWFVSGADGTNISFVDCVFRNNTATFGGGASVVSSGAAIGTSVSFSRCSFTNCVVSDTGGGALVVFFAAAIECPVAFSHCVWAGNRASLTYGDGGGVAVVSFRPRASPILFNNCHWVSNSAFGGGGSYISHRAPSLSSPVEVWNCTASQNAGRYGGGMFIGAARVSVSHTLFEANKADSGGGMYLKYALAGLAGATLEVAWCKWSNNIAQVLYGGGIGVEYTLASPDSRGWFTSCSWENNSAAIAGGGIYVSYKAPVSNSSFRFVDCNWTENQASWSGGGVGFQYFMGSSASDVNVSFSHCSWLQNSARVLGGGMFLALPVNVALPQLPCLTCDPNLDGHFIPWSISATVTLSNVVLGSNNCQDTSGQGGALFVSGGGHVHILDAEYYGNSALLSGGAVSIAKGVCLTLDGATFESNHASDGGTLSALTDGDVKLSNVFARLGPTMGS
jgi:hypothetical protein